MPKYENEAQKFRHRGYVDLENNKIVMIFGDGAEPVDSHGQVLQKQWDHDVSQETKVIDHV